jgi:hypothetical protein
MCKSAGYNKPSTRKLRAASVTLALILSFVEGSTGATAQHAAIIPDPTLTPGAVRTTDIAEICGQGTTGLRHGSRERDDRIMVEYGLRPGPHPDFEVDHLIPLGIGGSDDDHNLWPEPRRELEPVWSADRKDELEWKLRELVCAGSLHIRVAQQAIADDWVQAYKTYMNKRTAQDAGR